MKSLAQREKKWNNFTLLLVWGCFTYGGDYGESEEEALSKAPVWPVEISPPGTDAPVQNVLQQFLQFLRLHTGVLLQKLSFLMMNFSLVDSITSSLIWKYLGKLITSQI